MQDAIISNNAAQAQQLLDAGFDPDQYLEINDMPPNPALAFALMLGRKEIALKLISAGADVHKTFKNKADGVAVSMLAASILAPHKEVIGKLLDAGLDPNEEVESSEDEKKAALVPFFVKCVWQCFAICGYKDIVELMLEKYPDLKMEAEGGFSIVDILQPQNNPELLRIGAAALVKLNRSSPPVGISFMRMTASYAEAIKEEKAGKDTVKAQEFITLKKAVVRSGTKQEQELLIYIGLMDEGKLLIAGEVYGLILRMMDTSQALCRGGNETHKAIARLIEEKIAQRNTPRPGS